MDIFKASFWFQIYFNLLRLLSQKNNLKDSWGASHIARPTSLAIWHRGLASQAKLQRESESQALRAAWALRSDEPAANPKTLKN